VTATAAAIPHIFLCIIRPRCGRRTSTSGADMRVYISVDMEGVAGVVHQDQTDPVDPRHAGEYNRFRRLMPGEANAAIEGALAAGASAVLVNDSHWLMRNLLAEELHPAAELLSGGPKLRSMVEGVELGFDAALFVGYHARAGAPHAIIDHTYTSRVHEARLNGRPVGELAINAALAGTYGVPVAMVSGDLALAAEASELLGPGVGASPRGAWRPRRRAAGSATAPRARSPGGTIRWCCRRPCGSRWSSP
jgi:D-aminopeptidase